MGFLRDIKQFWPKGSPLPGDGIFFFYSPQHDTEFKVLPEQLAPPVEAPGPAEISAEDILDATPAGVALLTAGSAEQQQQLLDHYVIDPEGDFPGFSTVTQQGGAMDWAVEQLRHLLSQASPAQPEAPANGHVDDQGNTLYGDIVPGFPAAADYEVTGVTGFPGVVNLATTGGDVQVGTVYARGITGERALGTVGIRVTASGNRPAGKWLLNTERFTASDGAGTGSPPPATTTYTGNYTPTAQDIAAACGSAGGTGQLTTRTSTESQAAADLAAKNAALAGIVCNVPASYNTALTASNQFSPGGVSFPATGTAKLRLNDIPTASGPTISVVFTAAGYTIYVDYPSEFGGQQFEFTDNAGAIHTANFPTSNTTLAY
ncbi:hypothetical protein HHL22_20535 [Hymenobacter sp. RP-2-7]|uniref:Uncharacterized protein n=1 Tax=Hymenobacter polaris TaxID=2682546 RepID=A0A7Y0AI99_9BACT|nr:hypothetical protein [Hymenobacter polaris]NML67595.1 hypothetical protein [Hymenobacter polaris]